MKYPKWLLGPVNQCAYVKADGHNLYDQAGNPMLLSPRALNESYEPLRPHEYSLTPLPEETLHNIHPGKNAGDVLQLNLKTHNTNTYYLSALKNHKLPIQNKDGYRVYQMFKDISLNVPCYDWYYQEIYKTPDNETPGVACLYVALETKDKQTQYSIPPDISRIDLASVRNRGIFQHRVQRHIKVPNNEPLIVNPFVPPLQIEYDDLDIWAWLNRLAYFFFSIPEGLAKLIGIAVSVTYNLAGKAFLQIPYNLSNYFHKKLNLQNPADSKKNHRPRLLSIVQVLLWIPITLLYATGNILLHFGKIAQIFCNVFASLCAIPTGYFRAGGVSERCKIASNQFYYLLIALASIAVFVPQWIGNALCMNFGGNTSQEKQVNFITSFAAKIFYSISIFIQGMLECTGGMADLESYHHELALHNSIITRCARIASIRIKCLIALITATFKDIKTTFFPNKEGPLKKNVTEIDKVLTEQCYRPSVLQNLEQSESIIDEAHNQNNSASKTQTAQPDNLQESTNKQLANSTVSIDKQQPNNPPKSMPANVPAQDNLPDIHAETINLNTPKHTTQRNNATVIDSANIAAQFQPSHAAQVR